MKITSLALSLFALAGFAGAAQAANEIKLLEASNTYQAYYIGFSSTHIEAVVANLGANEVVNVHAQLADGTWADLPMTYNRPADNGRKVWILDAYDYGSTSRFGNKAVFALSYTVNGKTYWDNNNSANYTVPVNAGVLLYGPNVYQFSATSTAYNHTFTSVVTVKNIAPVKQVKLVYTFDGWKTTQVADGTYNANFWTQNYTAIANPSAAGFEEWTVSVPYGATASKIEYAIAYTVNGQTYWDNNFGANYTLPLAQ